MIPLADPPVLAPSGIVHAVAYNAHNNTGYSLVCHVPWNLVVETYRARVVTEIDPLGRTAIFSLTKDNVDCMTCLVRMARST